MQLFDYSRRRRLFEQNRQQNIRNNSQFNMRNVCLNSHIRLILFRLFAFCCLYQSFRGGSDQQFNTIGQRNTDGFNRQFQRFDRVNQFGNDRFQR